MLKLQSFIRNIKGRIFRHENARILSVNKDSIGSGVRIIRFFFSNNVNLVWCRSISLLFVKVFVNVPWWYLAYNRMISPFLTQRTKSKFVFAGSTKTLETLFKYIAPEQLPVQYGGLSKHEDQEFTTADLSIEEIIKPTCKHTIEFPVTEAGTLVWEVRVAGWDVSYGAEFLPNAEGGYTLIVQKARKIYPANEQVINCSFKTGEAGKVVLTFDNQTSKKKKLLYRSKVKPSE